MIGYIDPSSASLVWQGIVAAILGAGVAVKVFWKRIIGVFTRRSRVASEPAVTVTPSASPPAASPNGHAEEHHADSVGALPDGPERKE
jgi:hypothetical protein